MEMNKIGIVVAATEKSGGIYQYTKAILETLYASRTGEEFVIFTRPERQSEYKDFNVPGWRIEPINPELTGINNIRDHLCGDGLCLERAGVNQKAKQFFRKHQIDLMIYPSPVNFSFEWGIPYIMAVHDLQHRLQPEFPEVSAGNIWQSREYLFRNGVKFANSILTDSEIGKEDVLTYYGEHISRQQVHVLPFLPFHRPAENKIKHAQKKCVLDKYLLPDDFIFYPAQFWLHKNHCRLIHALQLVRANHKVDIPLVLVGTNSGGAKEEARDLIFKNAMDLADQLNVKELVHYIGYVPDEDMQVLYTLAKALVMPTFFGPTNIPVLEAWAFGCPVMSSDIRGVREQIGDAGLLVKPDSASDIADGILKLWLDINLQKSLINSGYKRISVYSPVEFSSRLNRIIDQAAMQLPCRTSPTRPICDDSDFSSVVKSREVETTDEKIRPEILVSAIVSAYNSERFMRGCIEDLEAQTIADRLEIIVIDSGSEQNEQTIVQEMQRQYGNIKYLKCDTRESVYSAWNRGIKIASGKYITSANTDDRHCKSAFERMVKVLETRSDVALVYADVIKTETENETFENCTPVGTYHWHDWDRNTLLEKGCFIGPQPMWRRSVHDVYGYFDGALVSSGDYEFWLRISQSFKFHHIRMPLGLYLIRPDSIEHAEKDTKLLEDAEIYAMYHQATIEGKIINTKPIFTKPEKLVSADFPQHTDIINQASQPVTGQERTSFVPLAGLPVINHTKQGGNILNSYEKMYQDIQPLLNNSSQDDAIAALKNLVISFPEFGRAHNDLGVLYYQRGDKENAVTHYQKAAQLQPENVTFKKNLADFYYVEQGRVEDALKIYVEVLAINPEDTETLQITGHICVALHKFEDAKVFYNRILEIEPWNAAVRENLAELENIGAGAAKAKSPEEMYEQIKPMMESGHSQEATGALEELLETWPDFASAHNDLGVLSYRFGDKEKSLKHYEEATRLEPRNITFQKNLADFYFVEQGRTEDALKIYVDILTAFPEDVETLSITGHICVALHKFEDAKVFYNRVLEIEPWNVDARENLAKLNGLREAV